MPKMILDDVFEKKPTLEDSNSIDDAMRRVTAAPDLGELGSSSRGLIWAAAILTLFRR